MSIIAPERGSTGRLLDLPADFFAYLHKVGIDISRRAASFPYYNTVFEAPTVVQYTEMGIDCTFGAYSGIYGRSNGSLSCSSVGRFCSIADGFVFGPDEHPLDYLTSSMTGYVNNVHGWDDLRKEWAVERQAPYVRFHQKTRVAIGNDVWIGANVFVRRGITIGDGAIVGAGSVVTKDVAPYSIVAGNPARFIRQRFPDNTIDRLMKVRWWEYDIFQIKDLQVNDVEESLDKIEDLLASQALQPLKVRAAPIDDLFQEWKLQK